MQRPKILLVEDERAISGPLAEALEREGFDPTVASGVREALERSTSSSPDLVLLDIGLPDGSGLDVCRELRRETATPIIMLTARGAEADRVAGLELGADDYIVKPFSHLVLLARIRAVLRRAELPPPVAAAPDFAAGELAINFQSHEVTVAGTPVRLTPVEYKLLFHLARNAGRLLPHQALLDRVWGADYVASPDYLKVFVGRLRAKLERPGGPRYIETERGLGYRFVRPKDPDVATATQSV